jgi:BlaR1 peptidase M56
VIPADFYERYSEAEQRLVIAHELAHVRRGDLYANAFATGLQITFWFNPLIHWATPRMRFDQELACDARVLGALPDLADQAKTYAGAVVKTAFPKHASPLTCHWQSRHPLNERILNMTAPKPRTALRRVAQFGLAALIAASCYGALAFADRAPSPGEGQYRIDFEYTGIESESPPQRNEKHKSFAIVLDANKTGSLKVGSIKVCEFEFAVSRIDEQKVRVRFPHKCNDERNPDANLIVKLGEPATIENGGDLPGLSWLRSLKFVVTDRSAKTSPKTERDTITRTSFRRN